MLEPMTVTSHGAPASRVAGAAKLVSIYKLSVRCTGKSVINDRPDVRRNYGTAYLAMSLVVEGPDKVAWKSVLIQALIRHWKIGNQGGITVRNNCPSPRIGSP